MSAQICGEKFSNQKLSVLLGKSCGLVEENTPGMATGPMGLQIKNLK